MKNLKNKKFLFICIIVIAILAITAVIFITNQRDGKWIVKKVKPSTSPSVSTITSMENNAINEQYNLVYYDTGKYITRKAKISNDSIEENLDSLTVITQDGENSINATVYSIKNIATSCAIAVQFENDSEYYVYVNLNYSPATLGEFLRDINFENSISFGTVNYDYIDEKSNEYKHIEFYDVDKNIILQKIFGDASIENVDRNQVEVSNASTPNIVLNFSSKELGYENQVITITDKGYILTNILDTDKTFYLGEEKMQEFLDYIIDNYQGYKIIYEDEGTSNGSSIVQYDPSTNTTTVIKTPHTSSGDSNTQPYIPDNLK